MQEEAEITINGTRLSDTESMTVRVAIDTLANVLAESVSAGDEDSGLASRYAASLTTLQSLLEARRERTQ